MTHMLTHNHRDTLLATLVKAHTDTLAIGHSVSVVANGCRLSCFQPIDNGSLEQGHEKYSETMSRWWKKC